jgi:2-polyprenyl-3-methyl-5-hydroxy-6-metoxy-1,4-benzoquinol methylase
MKIKQTNTENLGIEWNGDSSPFEGYQHHDALWFEQDKHITYESLAIEIYNNIILKNNIKTILELGSGAGSLSYFLREISNNEITIVTVDGNKETINSPYIKNDNHFIIRTDEEYTLVNELNEIIKFDLVLSFEHFEHICPGDRFDVFLEGIKKHIHEDSLILATASLQSTGNYHWHPNVKSLLEWISFLEKNGFEFINSNFIRNDTAPFNFPVHLTNELFFKLK